MRHVPRVVLLPTFHDQVTMPEAPAVLSPKPAAVDGPDLYSTSIEQRAFAAVLIVTDAMLLRGAVAVCRVTLTENVVGAVVGRGLAFVFAAVFAVATGFFDGFGE